MANENTLQHYKTVKKIAFISFLCNAVMSVAKLLAGWLGHSSGLLADGMHSFADIFIDLLVIVTNKYSNQAADIDHPYGHQRIETLVTMVLAAIIIATGIGILIENIAHIWDTQKTTTPDKIVLWIAIGSVFFNEILYQYINKIANQINSTLLSATAWHNRSDASASLVVAAGIFSSLLGYHYADCCAAIIVSVIILRMGVTLIWNSMQELIDKGASPDQLERIKTIITQVPGVRTLHQLRTRSMSARLLIDVHILVNAYLSVSEGHYIAAHVHEQLIKQLPSVIDVTVHVDSEDDEYSNQSKQLPARHILEPLLLQRWKTIAGAPDIERLKFHYLNRKISVDVWISLDCLTPDNALQDAKHLQRAYQEKIGDLAYIARITLLFILSTN